MSETKIDSQERWSMQTAAQMSEAAFRLQLGLQKLEKDVSSFDGMELTVRYQDKLGTRHKVDLELSDWDVCDLRPTYLEMMRLIERHAEGLERGAKAFGITVSDLLGDAP